MNNNVLVIILLALCYFAQAQKVFVSANGPSSNNVLDSVLYYVNMANGNIEPLVDIFVQVNLGYESTTGMICLIYENN